MTNTLRPFDRWPRGLDHRSRYPTDTITSIQCDLWHNFHTCLILCRYFMSAIPLALPHKNFTYLAYSAIGGVFGDIGTSPLYALKEIFHGWLPADSAHILGVLSLIFWTLTLVVATKYTSFIMRADNKGEGGIIALMALALQGSKNDPKRKQFIILLGLIGAALFYGDSIITPAISVLSAIEGIKVIAPRFDALVVPVTLLLLGALFVLQTKGSRQLSQYFSPIMAAWFAVLAILGLSNILTYPGVLMAINPLYA